MSTNYATVRQTDFIKDKLFNLEKQTAELSNKLAANDAKLAEIRAVCDGWDHFVLPYKIQSFLEYADNPTIIVDP